MGWNINPAQWSNKQHIFQAGASLALGPGLGTTLTGFLGDKKHGNSVYAPYQAPTGMGLGFLSGIDQEALAGGAKFENRGPQLQKAFLQGEMGQNGYLGDAQTSLEAAGETRSIFNQGRHGFDQTMNGLGASGLSRRYALPIANQMRMENASMANESLIGRIGESNARRFSTMLAYVNSASEAAWASKQGKNAYKIAMKGLDIQREAAYVGAAGQVLGGASQGAMMMSDPKVKKNVELVGVRNGQNLYEFEYKGKHGRAMPGRFEGVMADEVEKTRPDAVVTRHRTKHVDYAKLGLRMTRVG